MQALADKVTDTNQSTLDFENDSLLGTSNEFMFPEDNAEGAHIRYGYKIASMNFLVPEGVVSELIQQPNIFNLPNSPMWIRGLINIRGNIIPVMCLEKLLNLNSTQDASNILVFNKSDNDKAIAFMVDDLPVLLEQSENVVKAANYPDTLDEYLSEGFSQNNIDWIEFNPQKLFKNLSTKNE